MNPAKNKSGKSTLNAPHPKRNDTDETVESFVPTSEDIQVTKEELEEFLTSVEGIGKKKVAKIMEHFGSVEKVLEAIHVNPQSLSEVKSITEKLAQKIEKSWKKLLK